MLSTAWTVGAVVGLGDQPQVGDLLVAHAPAVHPMSIVATIGVGLAGALVGGLIAGLIGAGWLIAIILEVALSALLVYFLTSRRTVAYHQPAWARATVDGKRALLRSR